MASKHYSTLEAANYLGISYDALVKRLSRAGLQPIQMIGPNKFWSLRQLKKIS